MISISFRLMETSRKALIGVSYLPDVPGTILASFSMVLAWRFATRITAEFYADWLVKNKTLPVQI
jgi:hypothetical protein